MIGDHLYNCWLWWNKKDWDVKWWSLVSLVLLILITTITRMTNWILRDECSKKFYLWSLLWWNKNVMISDHWSLITDHYNCDLNLRALLAFCSPSAVITWTSRLYMINIMKSQDHDHHPDHHNRNCHDHDHYLDHHHLGPGLPGRLSLRSHCSLQLNRKAHVFSDQ